jgi:predicted nicotinamide N-methyase
VLAVLWQVTPRFAEWMVSDANLFFDALLLSSASNVLELGCGISGLLALVLAPRVKRYIATDQEYVLKGMRQNIAANDAPPKGPSRTGKHSRTAVAQPRREIVTKALDWENDSVSRLYHDLGFEADEALHMVIACDCIYNEALIEPFVTTCADICALGPSAAPTLCVVAQQLRSADVFEAWLRAFHDKFHVWRVDDEHLPPDLASGSGFVVHVGILRSANASK